MTVQWRNTAETYGLVTVLLHWLLALAIIGLFALGLWMVELDYYNAWYQSAPWWHKGFGVVVGLLMLLRWLWRLGNPVPGPEPTLSKLEWRLAVLGQYLFYALVALIVVSGFLIVTAEGEGLSVFDWFVIPALPSTIEQQEDLAGEVHKYLAWLLIGLAVLHSLAAFRHHFLAKDRTLLKILGR